MHAAGGLISTASDVSKWLLYNTNNGKVFDKQISPSYLVKKAHKSTVDYIKDKGQIFQGKSYGIGWHNATFNNKYKVIYHFGGYTGFQSHISFMPKEKIGVAIFANEDHFGDNISSIIASYVYELLLGKTVNEEVYDEKLSNLEGFQKRLTENLSKNNQKKSFQVQLTHPLKSYTGVFKNNLMGSSHITKKDNILQIKFGELKSTTTASSNINEVRVELIPGRTMDLMFKIDDSNVISEINSGGLTFKRINSNYLKLNKN